jgi:hypothetical protein
MEMAKTLEKYPLPFVVAKWYGIVFASFYIVYGAVKIVLGMMDHNFDDFPRSIIALLIGVLLAIIVYAYRQLKPWGWYGMVAVHSIVVIATLFAITDPINIILLVLSAATIGLLMSTSTRDLIFGRR